jgi:hypothetical protein
LFNCRRANARLSLGVFENETFNSLVFLSREAGSIWKCDSQVRGGVQPGGCQEETVNAQSEWEEKGSAAGTVHALMQAQGPVEAFKGG